VRSPPVFYLAAMLIFAGIGPSDAAVKRMLRSAPPEPAKKEQTVKVPPGILHIVVAIRTQRVSLFSNGALVTQSPISTGTAEHPTPNGVFSIVQKHRYHRSNIYSAAPMPFMQRITWSGVALHEGKLPGYPASHGCIRLTTEFAQLLWGTTRLGARVIVTQEEVTPLEIAHSNLFKPAREIAASEPVALVQTASATLNDAMSAVSSGPASNNKAQDAEVMTRDFPRMTIPAVDLPKWSELPMLDAPVRPKDAKKIEEREGPVSVFISREEGKLYVRQDFEALFEVPVTVREPERPIGTHVFTAMDRVQDGAAMRWTVLSIPAPRPGQAEKVAINAKNVPRDQPRPGKELAMQTASAALDRVIIPTDVLVRISELLTPGASLIISDFGLGETGSGTEFVVLTR